MKGIRFEKVSFEQFRKDTYACGYENISEDELREKYKNIKLPTRSTTASAGYDFIIPIQTRSRKKEPITIPTGIRVVMPQNVVLLIMPRSGQGFKYGLHLANTIGVIDSDYAYSDNEGHIMIKLTHRYKDFSLTLEEGKGFAQGVFVNYLTTDNDECSKIRNGGFGSTD